MDLTRVPFQVCLFWTKGIAHSLLTTDDAFHSAQIGLVQRFAETARFV